MGTNGGCEACKPGVNHQWHEFTTGSYVTTGFLSGGKRCVGEIDGSECGKLFVAKASALKGNESQLEIQPTLKRPAFGFTICGIGMCFECKNYYEENIRMSPSRKGRVGRIGNTNCWQSGSKRLYSGSKMLCNLVAQACIPVAKYCAIR
jgi:hypothetical protein